MRCAMKEKKPDFVRKKNRQEVSEGPYGMAACLRHSEGRGQLSRPGKSNLEPELWDTTEGRVPGIW